MIADDEGKVYVADRVAGRVYFFYNSRNKPANAPLHSLDNIGDGHVYAYWCVNRHARVLHRGKNKAVVVLQYKGAP